MLLRIKQALANIPITARVTLWYSFFIIAIVAALIAISAVVADEVFEDVSQKKLAKSVTKIANDMDEFEPYDDGIFFIKYIAVQCGFLKTAKTAFTTTTSQLKAKVSGSEA